MSTPRVSILPTPTTRMTAAEVADACCELTLDEIEAMEAGLESLARKRANTGLPINGAGDHLFLLREYFAVRRAEEG